jgi:4-alpha-glucanotransferase
LGGAAEEIIPKLFLRVGSEDLYIFKDEVGEARIAGLGLPEEVSRGLTGLYHDRLLIETQSGMFCPAWFRENSQAWASFSEEEKNRMRGLVRRYFQESEELWAEEGGKLLGFMKEASGMLPCAEDLGVVPDSVPVVLERLGILGLRIPRWVKRYHEAGEPFVPPAEYPRLSVCAASVHDTTTLREWWETETGRAGLWKALGFSGEAPASYSPQAAEKVFEGLLAAGSALVMFQLQDFFALEESMRPAGAAEERINVPGTVTDTNWSYRMPFCLENFDARGVLAKRVLALVKKRRNRKMS